MDKQLLLPTIICLEPLEALEALEPLEALEARDVDSCRSLAYSKLFIEALWCLFV